ncbi:MAG: sigma-70 family RNA polymerase sigma factor [Saprospiraceae bacterium]|nr:sigma-70 family RNA polymerase sigma factor [Saprospiraceae bacterium]
MNVPTKQTDIELIEQTLRGNDNAFEELVDQYKDYIYTVAYRVLGRPEEAEEAAQDAFIKAYRSLQGFDHRAKFSTWLYRIVLNTALSMRRKQKFYVEDIDDHKNFNAYSEEKETLKLSEQKKYLQEALNLLKEDDVTVLTLFYLKELHLEEIAEITGWEANGVKVKLFRARKRLAEKMRLILKDEVKSIL